MKITPLAYLMFGFITATVCNSACGGKSGEAIASTIGSAIDVVFNKSSTSLTSTTVQSAIEELAGPYGGHVTAATLAGTWTGTQYYHGQLKTGASITFNADNSFSCSGGIDESVSALGGSSSTNTLCLKTYTWELKGNTIVLAETGSTTGYRIIPISFFDGTNISFNFSLEIPSQYDFFYGTKQ